LASQASKIRAVNSAENGMGSTYSSRLFRMLEVPIAGGVDRERLATRDQRASGRMAAEQAGHLLACTRPFRNAM
jgi:hypothetical protein